MMENARRLREAVRYLIVAHGTLADTKHLGGGPLSLPHAHALLELLQHRTPMTVSDLAKTLSIDRTNVSRLCARMEQAGELTREPDPHDLRARILRLTPHGERVAQRVDERTVLHFNRLLDLLGDEGQRIIEALDHLQEAITCLCEDTEPDHESTALDAS